VLKVDGSGRRYLKFDGVDDGLQTNSIDFSGTDKMSVFAGVRKLSDDLIGTIAELSANSGGNSGTFAMFAPGGTGIASYGSRIRGTAETFPTASGVSAPNSSVLMIRGDIGGGLSMIRRNGVVAQALATDLGAGNFGNYPLYIGSRAGTSLPFIGHLYGLIVRGALSSDGQISGAESYLNGKTGAYL
jgi:hypothetical protein